MGDMHDTTAGEGRGDTLGGDLLVDDPAVLDFLHRLHEAGRGPVPEIGEELAAVLAAAAVPSITARRRRGPGRRGIAGVAVLGFMAAGAGAAAADGLPRPVQRVVSEVVSRWTPFDVPHPDDSTAPRAVPTPSSIPRPAESEDDVDEPQQAPAAPLVPDPARPASPVRQRGGGDGDDSTSGEGGARTDEDAGEDGHDGADRPAPTSRPTSDGGGSSHSGDDESDGSDGEGGGSDDSADDSTDGGEDHGDESGDRSEDRSSDHGDSDDSESRSGSETED